MTDARSEDLGDEDRLPWLEAVEEDGEDDGPSPLKLIASVVIGLICIAVVVGGLFWLGQQRSAGGEGEIIAAPEGDYKVPPDEPGGMAVEGTGSTQHQTSQGADPRSNLNVDAVAEAPVAQQPRQPATAEGAAPRPQARPAPPAATAGGTIQLGAFSSQAAANNAWKALSGRFRYLAPLSHSVMPVESGGRTLYRLRAGGPDAAGICRRLQVAGEDCAVVG